MSTFWRRSTGADPAPNRRETSARPRAQNRLRPGLLSLEGRQLLAITFATTPSQEVRTPEDDAKGNVVTNTDKNSPDYGNPIYTQIPGIVAVPQVLPNDGKYDAVTVYGQLTQRYSSTIDGPYAVTKYPYHLSANIAHQASLVPDSAYVGATDPVTQVYQPTAHMQVRFDGYNEVATLEKNPVKGLVTVQLALPPYEQQVAFGRLEERPRVNHVFVQVTDQYRQDQPRTNSPVQLNNGSASLYNITGSRGTSIKAFYDPTPNNPLLTYYSSQVYSINGKAFQVQIPTGVVLSNNYTYAATTILQGKANSGTNGRQYIVDVAATDADNGGESNVAVVVPGK